MFRIENKFAVYILISCVWLAWLCSILIVSQCNFMTKTTTINEDIFADFSDRNNDEDDDDNNNNNNNTEITRTVQQTFGLFTRPFYDNLDHSVLGCVRYSSSDDADTKFHTGQAFGIITVLLLTISFIISFGVVTFVTCSPKQVGRLLLWRVSHYISIGAAISQLFTFVALGSTAKCYSDDVRNGGCTISGSAILAILNTILLDGICLAWFFIAAPDTPLIRIQLHDSSTNTEPNLTVPEPLEDEISEVIHHDDQKISHGIDHLDETESIVSECTIADFGVMETTPIETINVATSPLSIGSIPSILHYHIFQYRLSTILLIIMAWIISIVGANRCTFIYAVGRSSHNYNDDDDSDPHIYLSGIGLFQMAIHDDEHNFLGCVSYPSQTIQDIFDDQFHTARAFSVITTLLTSSILIFGTLQLFLTNYVPKVWLATRTLLPLAVICQAATFTIFRSNVCNLPVDGEDIACQLGGTGKLVVLNVLLLTMIFVFNMICPVLNEPLFELTLTKSNVEHGQTGFTVAPSAKVMEVLSRGIHQKDEIRSRSDDISHRLDDASDSNVTSITIRVEYSDSEKTTRKIIFYQDGTQKIQTTAEELYDDEADAVDVDIDDNIEYCLD